MGEVESTTWVSKPSNAWGADETNLSEFESR